MPATDSRRPPPPSAAAAAGRPRHRAAQRPAHEAESGIWQRYRNHILVGGSLGCVLLLLLLILLMFVWPRDTELGGRGGLAAVGSGREDGNDSTKRDGEAGGSDDDQPPAATGNDASAEQAQPADPSGQETPEDSGQREATGQEDSEPSETSDNPASSENADQASAGRAVTGARSKQKRDENRITIQRLDRTNDEQEEEETDEEDQEVVEEDAEDAPSAASRFLASSGRAGGGGRGGLQRGVNKIFQGRTPRGRKKYAKREGGSEESEAAVDRGLEWLAKHQSEDGGWSLTGFSNVGNCNGQCMGLRGAGRQAVDDYAGTAMALLPFLGVGETPKHGKYKESVGAGLEWLMNQRTAATGYNRIAGYHLALLAFVLCEATALTGDENIREAAQDAIDNVVEAQHAGGGWRYSRGSPGDLSVTGWNIMAIRSAQFAELKVPEDAVERARLFLDATHVGDGLFTYRPGGGGTPSMTAEGLLCRQYTGWPEDHLDLKKGANFLIQNMPGGPGDSGLYYWYYATQVLHHVGGEPWNRWNSVLRDYLVALQENGGHKTGSWPGWPQTGGRLGSTALAICTLEVYYRHLRIYESGK